MRAADAVARELAIAVEQVRPGFARTGMRVAEPMLNGHGVCHGGYLFLLADTAFAYACNTYGEVTLAAAADIVFVDSARLDDDLVAEARERTRFGRNGIYDVSVRRRGDDAVIAEFRGHSRATGARFGRG
jgi:acyl-CoA thioesterase